MLIRETSIGIIVVINLFFKFSAQSMVKDFFSYYYATIFNYLGKTDVSCHKQNARQIQTLDCASLATCLNSSFWSQTPYCKTQSNPETPTTSTPPCSKPTTQGKYLIFLVQKLKIRHPV